MDSRNIKWIFFDIDDTLWNFSANSLKSLSFLYHTSSLLQSSFASEEAFINHYHSINHALWQRYNKGIITSDALKRERFLTLLWPEAGTRPANAVRLCDELNETYLNRLGNLTETIPGAIETLHALQPYYLIGALTNGFRNVQYRKILNSGLWRYIQRMVISDETPWHKPQTELFNFAAHAVGAHPEECLMIGDNPDTDIAGAEAAGWHHIYFNPDGSGDISSLLELLPMLLPSEDLNKPPHKT